MRCVTSPVEAQPAVGQRRQQPVLRLVDVPGAGQARVGRLEQHVAVRAGHLDVAAVQVVVEVDVLGLAARAADHDHLAAVAGQRHGRGMASGTPVASATISAPRAAEEARQLLADVAGGGIDDVIGAGGAGGLAAHGHGVDADHRIGAGRDQAAQGELADDAEAEHRGRAAQREPGADRGAQAVAGDAGQRGLLDVEARPAASRAGRARGRSSAARPRRGCRDS